MSFSVDPQALSSYSRQVDRAAEDIAAIGQTHLRPIGNELAEGLLQELVVPALDDWQTTGERQAQLAADLGSASARNLVSTARYYRNTDLGSAEQLDATYPAFSYDGVPPGSLPDGPSDPFADWREPTVTRPSETFQPGVPPEAQVAGDSALQLVPGEIREITGRTSVAGPLRELAARILGLDPFDLTVRFVAGSWDFLAEDARRLEAGASRIHEVQINIDRGRAGIEHRWTGNAASESHLWMSRYSQGLAEFRSFLLQASQAMADFARAAYHYLAGLNNALNSLIDALINAALLTAAPIVGGLISAFSDQDVLGSAAAVLAAYTRVSTILSALQQLGTGFQATAAALSAQLNGPSGGATWPDAPYDHPEA